MRRTTALVGAGTLAALLVASAPAWAAIGHGALGFGVSPLEVSDISLLHAATTAGCLPDVRNIDTFSGLETDLRQRTNINPRDALLAIDFGLTTGFADINDVLDIKRDFAVDRVIVQDADLNARNVASAIALGGGICRGAHLAPGLAATGGFPAGGLGIGGGFVPTGVGSFGIGSGLGVGVAGVGPVGLGVGGVGHVGGLGLGLGGLGFVSPLDIADVRETVHARDWLKQDVSLNRNTVLAGIALGNVGLPGVHDLSDLANKRVHRDIEFGTTHDIRLNERQALLDIALLG